MVNEGGETAGTTFHGSGLAAALTRRALCPPADLQRRLSRAVSLSSRIGGRPVSVRFGSQIDSQTALAVPVRVGDETCVLHLTSSTLDWLQSLLGLAGSIADEEPVQRALLLEFASIDLICGLEAHLGRDVRVGDGIALDPLLPVDLEIVADDGTFHCRLEIPPALAETLADGLDRLQPPDLPEPSQITAEIVVEVGSQELSAAELTSLRPGDVVMLDPCRPSAVVEGLFAAPVVRRTGGVLLVAPFAQIAGRAKLPDVSENGEDEFQTLLRVGVELGRVVMTPAEIDQISPGDLLSLAPLDGSGVDLVIGERRVGRGELVAIGEGTGVRIVRLDFEGLLTGEKA